MRGSTAQNLVISIHALLAESDHSRRSRKQRHPNFYPRSPCGERLHDAQDVASRLEISIHALLAESDLRSCHLATSAHNFYPRSPCGERQNLCGRFSLQPLFLSTLSLRRATASAFGSSVSCRDFYPRSPCGERHMVMMITGKIHHFYPRSPCGERLYISDILPEDVEISIHALLAESDGAGRDQGFCGREISIHALLAESDGQRQKAEQIVAIFLSTLSLRRATTMRGSAISRCSYFYPRSPCGERPSAGRF